MNVRSRTTRRSAGRRVPTNRHAPHLAHGFALLTTLATATASLFRISVDNAGHYAGVIVAGHDRPLAPWRRSALADGDAFPFQSCGSG